MAEVILRKAMDLLKLLIVADDPLARAGLALLLANVANCEVVGQVSSVDVAEEVADADEAHVIIWDMGWELPDKLPALAELNLPVVALLPHDTEVNVVWATGVKALLSREVDVELLVTAARAAVQGLVVFDADIAQQLLPVDDGGRGAETAVESLTPREREVLQLVAEGLTNKAIARQLYISDHTVKFHMNTVMSKLGAQSRTDAVVRATRLGLILL